MSSSLQGCMRTRGAAPTSPASHWGFGVPARTHASTALVQCTVSDCLLECVKFSSAATSRLDRCTLSGSKSRHGLCVAYPGSCVHAAGCHFLGSIQQCGVAVVHGGNLTADICTSSGNRVAGYSALGEGSVLVLTNCSSNGDGCGCLVQMAAKLTVIHVVLTASELNGCQVASGASAVLRDCTAANCGTHAVLAQDTGSQVEMECCTLQHNQKCGVHADKYATVQLRDCSSGSNGLYNYRWWTGASVISIQTSSHGDKGGGHGEKRRLVDH